MPLQANGGRSPSDTSEIKSFDEAPATMLHLVVRKGAALKIRRS